MTFAAPASADDAHDGKAGALADPSAVRAATPAASSARSDGAPTADSSRPPTAAQAHATAATSRRLEAADAAALSPAAAAASAPGLLPCTPPHSPPLPPHSTDDRGRVDTTATPSLAGMALPPRATGAELRGLFEGEKRETGEPLRGPRDETPRGPRKTDAARTADQAGASDKPFCALLLLLRTSLRSKCRGGPHRRRSGGRMRGSSDGVRESL